MVKVEETFGRTIERRCKRHLRDLHLVLQGSLRENSVASLYARMTTSDQNCGVQLLELCEYARRGGLGLYRRGMQTRCVWMPGGDAWSPGECASRPAFVEIEPSSDT